MVLYPEIVDGNPLQAKNVIRWFLHKPGFHTGSINYGMNELYFFYQHAFNDAWINPDADNLLRVGWMRSDVYQKHNYGERYGSCYAIRKGKGRKIVHDLSDSICIDNLAHEEIASLFNSKKFFYSYDPYTMFTTYAAVCGCIPIVVPPEGLSKEEWKPMNRRFGVAYGSEEGEIKWAIETRDKLLASIEERSKNEDTLVSKFVSKCESFFLNRSK